MGLENVSRKDKLWWLRPRGSHLNKGSSTEEPFLGSSREEGTGPYDQTRGL